MPLEVTNRAGKRSSFASDRFAGTLVRAGVAASDALAYARAVEARLNALGRASVTTDQLRFVVVELVGSCPHDLAVTCLLPGVPPSPGVLRQPVRVTPSGVFPFILDPPIRDSPPQPGPFIQRIDSSPGQPVGYKLPVDSLERARDAALSCEQIQDHLKKRGMS